jgi:hypothetical protein
VLEGQSEPVASHAASTMEASGSQMVIDGERLGIGMDVINAKQSHYAIF